MLIHYLRKYSPSCIVCAYQHKEVFEPKLVLPVPVYCDREVIMVKQLPSSSMPAFSLEGKFMPASTYYVAKRIDCGIGHLERWGCIGIRSAKMILWGVRPVCLHSKDIVVVQDIRLANYHVQTYNVPFESKSANMSYYGFKLVSAHTTPYIKFLSQVCTYLFHNLSMLRKRNAQLF